MDKFLKKVNAGKGYITTFTKEISELGGSDPYLLMRVTIPAEAEIRFSFMACTNLMLPFTLFNLEKQKEWVPGTGSRLVPSNFNFNFTNSATHQIWADPEVASFGTRVIPSPGTPTGRGLAINVGQHNIFPEPWIIYPGAELSFGHWNQSGSPQKVGFSFYGYEEDL